jgi:hypothetical protein
LFFEAVDCSGDNFVSEFSWHVISSQYYLNSFQAS